MTKYFLIIFSLAGILLISCNNVSLRKEQINKENNNKYAVSFIDSLVVYKTEDFIIQKLSNHIYEHISFLKTNNYGKVASNGMIAVNGNEAVVFDAPTNNQSTKELINYISHKLKYKIIAVIPTHFHEDCVGGLKEFIEHNIPVYASNRTIGLLNEEGEGYSKLLLTGFDDSLTLNIGDQKVYAKYFGEGHTKDNIVGYFPEDSAVFGGCLIKEVGASKGYLGDANVKEWSETVRKVEFKYSNAKIVIPGHGKWGGTELFDYTIKLFSKNGSN